jgi:hypothetical protein
MKVNILMAVLCAVVLWSCEKQQEPQSKEIILSGTIAKQGITTYQYGAYIINTTDEIYALRSNTIDLENYVAKSVTLTAEKISGYPVENGPDYLEVKSVQLR